MSDVRIATMSLLVVVDDPRLVHWARERADMLETLHATRVTFVDVGAGDDALAAAPARVAGVPRVLLWIGARTASDEHFMRLVPEMRAILVDSSRTCDDAAALRDLVAFHAGAPENAAVRDLAYLRLAPWQEVVADFFDERAFVEDLFDIQRVTIASGSDAEGYYLLGWLASRLGWEPHGERRFRPRGGARAIAYELVREGEPRRVKRIALESHATQFVAELCESDSAAVSLEVSGAKERPSRVEPLHDVDTASLVERAILREQPDPVFFESLEVAGRLLGA